MQAQDLRTRSGGDAQPLASALGTSLSMLLATAIAPFRGEIDEMHAQLERLNGRLGRVEGEGTAQKAELDELRQSCRGMQHELDESKLAGGEAQTVLKMLDDRCAQTAASAQESATDQAGRLDGLEQALEKLRQRAEAAEAELGERATVRQVELGQRKLGAALEAAGHQADRKLLAAAEGTKQLTKALADQLQLSWQDQLGELQAAAAAKVDRRLGQEASRLAAAAEEAAAATARREAE
eukprot:SAG22_NODE_1067_length_5742_cov_15.152224_1_plen_238_part_10